MLDKPASNAATRTSGPLAGFRIVEFAGIGPGPFACMMLADMGAEVVTLDRVGAGKNMKSVAGRGRKIVELDLKDKAAVAQVLDLLAGADALIEGFRPGVMERLLVLRQAAGERNGQRHLAARGVSTYQTPEHPCLARQDRGSGDPEGHSAVLPIPE